VYVNPPPNKNNLSGVEIKQGSQNNYEVRFSSKYLNMIGQGINRLHVRGMII
jgi:hypothetical protein